jgi:hypothetical protein
MSPSFTNLDLWKGFDSSFGNVRDNLDPGYALPANVGHAPHTELIHSAEHDGGIDFGMGWDFPQSHADLHGLFEPSFCGNGADVAATSPDFHAINFGYEYNDMAQE